MCSISPESVGGVASDRDVVLSSVEVSSLGFPSESGVPTTAASTHLRGYPGSGQEFTLFWHFYSALSREVHFHCSDVGITRCCNLIGGMPGSR